MRWKRARSLNHNYIGTEHILLLGLIREQEGVAAQVLVNLGLELEIVREAALSLLGTGKMGSRFDGPGEFAQSHPSLGRRFGRWLRGITIGRFYELSPLFARFTDRAHKVMRLANQEAQRLDHEFIGTGHILLGLAKEGSGVAAHVLKVHDVDQHKIHVEVEKHIVPGSFAVTGNLLLTPQAKKAIEYAKEEARHLNHNYVGTEHLLLGLLRDQDGFPAQVLINLGLNLEDVRQEILNLLGHGQ